MKYSIRNWAALAFFGLALALAPSAHAQSASKFYKMAQSAEQKDDIETAYQDYYQAYQKAPKDDRYKEGYERTRFPVGALHVQRGQKLRAQGDTTGALTEFLRAIEIDPSNELAQQEIQSMRKQADATAQPLVPETPAYSNEGVLDTIGAPLTLKPLSKEPLTLHTVEDSKVIYQTVGKLAGINVLFDPDYTSKRIPVDLTNVDLYDALRIIGTVSGTFWRPITDNTIFVALNSRTKRTELEEQAVQTFYLTNVAQQNDFTDVQTALRNMFQTAKVYGVASQNAIVMRGTPDELLLAQKLINDLDKAKPEVVVDVAVLEVSRNYERTIGIQLPQTVGVSFQESNLNDTDTSSTSSTTTGTTGTSTDTSNGLTLNNLAHLNGTNFAVSIGSATANLLLTDSSTKILQNPRVRASDGQEASLKIGERLPVATGSYQTGAATAVVSSLVNTQFQYLDVGVNVTIKPTVHYDRDVTLKVKIEVSGTSSNSNIGGIEEPIITQRVVEQTIRLKEGEANILGGILQKQTSLSLSGTPGLAQLPILKYLFGSNDKTITDDEIVFLLIPHVVRAQMLDPMNLREVDTGTGNGFELRRMSQADAQAAIQNAGLQNKFIAAPNPAQGDKPVSAASAAVGALAGMQDDSAAASLTGESGPVRMQLTPEMGQQKVGSTFKMAIRLDNGTDVFSVPMQLKYDQSKLSLVNVDLADPGSKATDLLGQDGQAVALVHRDDGNGSVSISASRPPGTKGVNGSGTVCVLTFQAKAVGDATVVLTRPGVRNSEQKAVPATGSRALVQVRP